MKTEISPKGSPDGELYVEGWTCAETKRPLFTIACVPPGEAAKEIYINREEAMHIAEVMQAWLRDVAFKTP